MEIKLKQETKEKLIKYNLDKLPSLLIKGESEVIIKTNNSDSKAVAQVRIFLYKLLREINMKQAYQVLLKDDSLIIKKKDARYNFEIEELEIN